MLSINDVIQVKPHDPPECIDACLMTIEEVFEDHYVGSVACPKVKGELPQVALFEVKHEDCAHVGEAFYELAYYYVEGNVSN